MNNIESILTLGCTFVFFFSILLFIDKLYKQIRAEEEKFKAQKEKIFRLKSTSYRRGIR